MSKRKPIALLLALPLVFGSVAPCQDRYTLRPRTEEHFEARGPAITADKANAAYLHTLIMLKLANPNKGCKGMSRERCVDGRYKPPFPPALSIAGLERRSGWQNPDRIRTLVPEDEFSWAPADAVSNSRELIQRYRILANTGALFGCEGVEEHTCSFITSASSQPNVLVACYVAETGDPPAGCAPLLLSDGGKEWIAIVTQEADDIGGPADDYVLQILAKGSGLEPKILELVYDGLHSPPLGLRVSFSPSGYSMLKGLSEYRPSAVLPGWREYVIVRMDLDNDQCVQDSNGVSRDSHYYCLRYSAQLWINRQNTDLPADWHRPSEAQEKRYELTVATSLRQSLSRLCAAPSWRGDNILRCD